MKDLIAAQHPDALCSTARSVTWAVCVSLVLQASGSLNQTAFGFPGRARTTACDRVPGLRSSYQAMGRRIVSLRQSSWQQQRIIEKVDQRLMVDTGAVVGGTFAVAVVAGIYALAAGVIGAIYSGAVAGLRATATAVVGAYAKSKIVRWVVLSAGGVVVSYAIPDAGSPQKALEETIAPDISDLARLAEGQRVSTQGLGETLQDEYLPSIRVITAGKRQAADEYVRDHLPQGWGPAVLTMDILNTIFSLGKAGFKYLRVVRQGAVDRQAAYDAELAVLDTGQRGLARTCAKIIEGRGQADFYLDHMRFTVVEPRLRR